MGRSRRAAKTFFFLWLPWRLYNYLVIKVKHFDADTRDKQCNNFHLENSSIVTAQCWSKLALGCIITQ